MLKLELDSNNLVLAGQEKLAKATHIKLYYRISISIIVEHTGDG